MKPGIKVLRDIEGLGTEIANSRKVTITYSCYLNDGDAVFENRTEEIDIHEIKLSEVDKSILL